MEVSKQSLRFGERLITSGALSRAQLDLALRELKRGGGTLGETLVQLGFITPQILSDHLAREAAAQTVNLTRATVDQSVLALIPLDLAKQYRAMPLARANGTLTVALADPFNVVAIDMLGQITGLNIDVVTAPEQEIINCLERYYAHGQSIEESIDQALDERAREEEADGEAQPLEEVLAQLGDTDTDAPVIRLVSQIITRAIHHGASDIHFEPEEHMMRIRTRLDGVLQQDVLIPKAMQPAVTSRMKILADLDVAESRLPQDGRATVLAGGRKVNLRVSSLPTCYGENVVARILDPNLQAVTLASLGLTPEVEKAFRKVINNPYGMVLATGPTGSGKSTTLYAVLREVSTMELSTFTLEDPIEYRMSLVRQTQIKEEIGLTFSAGLRSLLRQDPDIILVGETRDTETAQLMVRAALTGHLVFSTLHTNDAPGAIPRLIDMGVEPFLLPASLLAVLAQRLVRTICRKCREEVKNPERIFEELKLQPLAGAGPLRLWRGVGCPECKHTGYKGRQGVFELMILDERFHDPIVNRAGAPEYYRLARESGMRTMFEDALLKAQQGLTTIEELLQVTQINGH